MSGKGAGSFDGSNSIQEPGAGAVEVNTEAIITADDLARAGGFGTRDDIGSFLPVALDSTDFEASLRDSQEFEEPQPEVRKRPGLGWTDAAKE